MARSQLLVALAALIAASGCGQDLPVDIFIDRFEGEELGVVSGGIAEWNAVGKTYLGIDEMLNVVGRTDSHGGFRLKDLQDDRHVVYRDWADQDEKDIVDDYRGYETNGYGTLSDVVLGVRAFYPRDKAGKVNGPLHRDLFRRHVLHEVGHFLGLLHSESGKTIMFSSSLDGEADWSVTHLTRRDIIQFCTIYDCNGQP
jgi:hypothetical protein